MTSAFADPPITPKAAATRARLLEIAATGVHRARLCRSLAAGHRQSCRWVTKGAIYGHFRSKGQLLVEVIRTQLAERDAQFDINAVAEQPMTAFVQFINPDSRDLRLLQIDAAAAARHDPDVAAGVEEIYAARSAWILDTLRRLDSPETLLYIINALSAGVGAQEAHGRPAPDPDVWAEIVGRMFKARHVPLSQARRSGTPWPPVSGSARTEPVPMFAGSEGSVHYERWVPDGRARRIVVVVHGYAEYAARYGHVAERLMAGRRSGLRRGSHRARSQRR